MKRFLGFMLVLLGSVFIMGCPSPDDSIGTDTMHSKLVIVNGTGYIGLSVYMREVGTSDWGSNLLYQCYNDGHIPAHRSCIIEKIEFGTYDLYAYIYGNYYRYNVSFDHEAGIEWGFY